MIDTFQALLLACFHGGYQTFCMRNAAGQQIDDLQGWNFLHYSTSLCAVLYQATVLALVLVPGEDPADLGL